MRERWLPIIRASGMSSSEAARAYTIDSRHAWAVRTWKAWSWL